MHIKVIWTQCILYQYKARINIAVILKWRNTHPVFVLYNTSRIPQQQTHKLMVFCFACLWYNLQTKIFIVILIDTWTRYTLKSFQDEFNFSNLNTQALFAISCVLDTLGKILRRNQAINIFYYVASPIFIFW